MLHDFHFKIIHRARTKHANVNTLNINLIGKYEVDEDFGSEIQDLNKIAREVSMSSTTKRSEIINNLFIVMERDATPDHTEVHTHKGKYITLY
jgi:hypothetical protein